MLIDGVSGLPLEGEVHEGVSVHDACELGGVHFALHPAEGCPGVPDKNAQGPDGNHVEILEPVRAS